MPEQVSPEPSEPNLDAWGPEALIKAFQARDDAMSVVSLWFRMYGRSPWTRYVLPLIAGFSIVMLMQGYLVFGGASFLISMGLTVFNVSTTTKAMQEIIAALTAAGVEHPGIMDDPKFSVMVLERAKPLSTPRGQRVAALVEAAEWAVGPEGPLGVTDCAHGHPDVCAHRSSAAAVDFWRHLPDLYSGPTA